MRRSQTITAASNITATRTIAVSADPSPPSGFHPVSFSIQSMAVTPTGRVKRSTSGGLRKLKGNDALLQRTVYVRPTSDQLDWHKEGPSTEACSFGQPTHPSNQALACILRRRPRLLPPSAISTAKLSATPSASTLTTSCSPFRSKSSKNWKRLSAT